MHFVNFGPENQRFTSEQKKESVQNFRTFTISILKTEFRNGDDPVSFVSTVKSEQKLMTKCLWVAQQVHNRCSKKFN